MSELYLCTSTTKIRKIDSETKKVKLDQAITLILVITLDVKLHRVDKQTALRCPKLIEAPSCIFIAD
jgi:hypothetical protein